MSDRWTAVLALTVFAAALAAVDGHLRPIPLISGPAVLAATWVLGRRGRALGRRQGTGRPRLGGPRDGRPHPGLLCLAVALLASSLGQRSVSGLDAPLDTGPIHAEVALVGDPEPDGRGGVRVDVRLEGRRLRASARVAAASALDDRLAGERVTVIGRVAPPGPHEAWLRHRHIAGRLTIDTVTGWRAGEGVTRLANGLRRTLAHGAESMPERQRSLLAGVTLGDDRAQPADMTDAFRASGLTHLLAVSGQNVAFVLVVVAPLLTRLRFGPRLVGTLAVLALFALVTRAEPSVLRATAMAAVAAVGGALGRPASTVRTLALGVAGMVLIDPLLVTSLGFRLSVAGAGGIVVGAARLDALLPGPRWLAAPLAVTLSAQAAVSPLLVAAFGTVPLASLPANLLAAPAAGPLMVWGLTGGLLAGVVGGPVAWALHLPTRLLLYWLEGVAVTTARWPLGELGAGYLVLLAVAGSCLVAGRALAHRPKAARALLGTAGLVAATVVVAAGVPARGGEPEPLEQPLGAGATLWRGGGAVVVVLDGRARDDAILSGLRRERVERVDVAIVRTSARAAVDVVETMRRRWPGALVLTPRPDGADSGTQWSGVEDAISPPRGTAFRVGGLDVTVAANTGGQLEVDIAPRPPPPDPAL